MTPFNNTSGRRAVLLFAAAAALLSACTKVDDTLGSDFIPSNQEMKLRTADLRSCFETRLYRTDSIRTSNINAGFIGSTRNDTFGLRTAGFFSQYRWVVRPSEEGFGYRPIFDSVQLILSVQNTGGDTTLKRIYEVYEVKDNSFLTQSTDSIFYGSFQIAPYLEAEPSFTFAFPDQEKGIYTTSQLVTMNPTDRGRTLVERLMLQKDGLTMDIFDDQKEWFDTFKGLYIRPASDATGPSDGALYQTVLDESGFVIYGRNRDEKDPSLIRDTTTSVYYFYYVDSSTENLGNISINTFRHNYAGALLGDYTFEEDTQGQSTEPADACFVEGMGGVVSQITFTDALFEQLEALLAKENEGRDAGTEFRSMAFSKATLSLYGRESDYDWELLQPTPGFLDWLESSLPRLGLYTSYKTLTGIPDYNYTYENQGYTINYDGYLNRSQGCYRMDIKNYLQQLWNDYLQYKAGRIEEIPDRTIYLAPEAASINTFSFASVQGMGGGQNDVPMKLEIAYVMIR